MAANTSTINTELQKLVKNVRDIVILNELYSTHVFVESTVNPGKQSLDRTKDKTYSEYYRMLIEYSSKHHEMQYKTYWMHVMFLTIGALSLSAIVVGYVYMLTENPDSVTWVMWTFLALIWIVYLILVIKWYGNVKKRTQYNWNRIYFKPPVSV